MPRSPLTGPSVWTGTELAASGDWIRSFTNDHIAEIEAALAQVKRLGAVLGFPKEAFPLPHTAALLADVSHELENGRGAVRLRGLPVNRYAPDDLRRIFWGIGRHLGTALF